MDVANGGRGGGGAVNGGLSNNGMVWILAAKYQMWSGGNNIGCQIWSGGPILGGPNLL